MDKHRAFTLVEMLAVLAILAVVVTISVPAFGRYVEGGRQTTEVSAARKLVASYLSYAADNDGYLMAGYQAEDVSDASGQAIHFPANARYPWRLAAFLDYDMKAILFNGNENALKDKVDFHYAASVRPNLGMNAVFVGGHYGSGSPLVPGGAAASRFGPFCVTRLGHASKPSQLIVFASAREKPGAVGYFEIRAPNLMKTEWSGKWDPKAPADAFGHVDLRWDDRAVAAMLDGHVELLDEDQMRDMRRWSNQAAEQNNPNYTLQRQPRQ